MTNNPQSAAAPSPQASEPDPALRYRPSETYKESQLSIVYRLSEAMFASLLASYIIGFIGALPALSRLTPRPETSIPLPHPFLPLINLLVVLVVFALLTAAVYLRYNMCVLTMPSYDLHRGNRDFMFAITQGIFFGVTMVFQEFLVLFVGIIFGLTLLIQNYERRHLVSYLKEIAGIKPDPSITDSYQVLMELKRIDDDIAEEIEKAELREWRAPRWYEIAGTAFALVLGTALVYFSSADDVKMYYFDALSSINLLTAIAVGWPSYTTIGRCAHHFKRDQHEEHVPDQRFKRLISALRGLATSKGRK